MHWEASWHGAPFSRVAAHFSSLAVDDAEQKGGGGGAHQEGGGAEGEACHDDQLEGQVHHRDWLWEGEEVANQGDSGQLQGRAIRMGMRDP